jgi:hypothetical protein
MRYMEERTGQSPEVAPDVNVLMAVIAELLRQLAAQQAELATIKGQGEPDAELKRKYDLLRSRHEEMEATIRRLEIGFRRHLTEKASPDQLRLELIATRPDASGAPEAGADAVDGATSADPAAPGVAGATEQDPDPAGRRKPPGEKKRDNHGRRRARNIPSVRIDLFPPEVMLDGLANFQQIGYEDSPMIGWRRGGPVELVFRRFKFVARGGRSGATVAPEEPSTPAAETSPASPDTGTAARTPDVTVNDFQMRMLPTDTAFKRSPFVDGAIVRYTPWPTAKREDRPKVLIAPPPMRAIDKGMADASLLAHILVHKQDYHTPYYRQEKEFERLGWPISRTNMSRWQFECGRVLMRLTDAIWKDCLTRSWIAMDATGTAVRDKGASEHRYGHVVALVAPGDGVLFKFTPKYDGTTVAELFGGFTGTVVADASANHNILFGPGKATEAGCWYHLRRKFYKALRAHEGPDAAHAMQVIQALSRIEEEAVFCSPQERLLIRRERSLPIVEEFFAWVDSLRPRYEPQDCHLRTGLNYAYNQREALREFLRNGEIPISNNASERALRRIVKGRMNWLFHGSDDHARCACAVASLIASCEIHGMDPEIYLQEILTVLPSWSTHDLLELSPRNWVATRQRLIAERSLHYIDLATIMSSSFAQVMRG